MKKTLFITGGAGFIGAHAVISALEKGFRVVNFDCLTSVSNKDNLSSYENHTDYHFFYGDLRNPQDIEKAFQEFSPHCVLHFAAETHVDVSISSPQKFIESNVLGTFHLLEASKKYGIEKFVHISTDEVYGDLQKHEAPFTENSLIKPSSPYSASKASSDLLVLSYIRTYGFPAVITRCSNNYGPFQDSSKFIPVIIKSLQEKKKIPLYGKGENIRDWIFVKDHVDAVFTVLEKGRIGEVYNVGANTEKTNTEIIETILPYFSASSECIQYVPDRKGHDVRYALNTTKIETELNWKPKVSFEEGISQTIKWYES
jgi:dTDP-glucose 4,6-dehydratase